MEDDIDDVFTRFNEHTTNGKYVQIRTKGGGKKVDKSRRFAYYFLREFLISIVGDIEAPPKSIHDLEITKTSIKMDWWEI